MKQLWTVFKFEFSNYAKSKSFIIFSIVLCAILLISTTVPTIINIFKSNDEDTQPSDSNRPAACLIDSNGILSVDSISVALDRYSWTMEQNISEEQIEQDIKEGKIELAVVVATNLDYKIFSKTYNRGETAKSIVSELLAYSYKLSVLTAQGLSLEDANNFLNIIPSGTHISLGENYMQNYFYAYVLVFILYMSLMIYGQLVASAVVTEKTSKAMEILITSAKPINLMFGKVLGVGAAGLSQLLVIILAGAVGVAVNRPSYADYEFILDILAKVDASLVFYSVVFFVFGFFIYAFMFAAFASTVSKPEEASSASTVPTMIIVVVFLLTMVGMSMPEETWVKVLSFIPFFTPMVMIMRIAMTEVPIWQILISIVELAVSLYLIGYLSAKIFHLGVLMYGKAPKLGQILKMLKQS